MPENSPTHRRLHRAADFAHLHCSQAIGLDDMATVAGLSRYQFLRAFSQQYLETPGAFLKRIRLERAAQMLVYQRYARIIEVAMECGYSSSQSFARAFHTHFGSTPRDFRADNPHGLEGVAGVAREGCSAQPEPAIRIGTRPSYRVALLRRIGTYENCADCARYYGSIRQWAVAAGLDLACTPIIGVYWDNPNITPPELCRYDVCVPVAEHVPADDQVDIRIIAGGTFAAVAYEGSPDSLRDVWEPIHRAFPHFATDQRRCYEFYHPTTWNGDPCYVCADFCVPVDSALLRTTTGGPSS